MSDIFRTSVNVKIEVNLNFNLTGYDSVEYIVLKPDKTRVIWESTVGDEEKGITYYHTEENDLNVAGVYSLQPKVVFSNPPKVYFGKIVFFKVGETL